MEGNIVGEQFDEFVREQIKKRQSNQFGGYGTVLRTDDQIQYLNNRNAWVKLASSVDVLEGDITTPLPPGTFTPSGGGGFTPSGGGFTPGGGFSLPGSSGAGSTQTNTTPGPIPGLTNLQTVNYKSQKLRQIGIPNPQDFAGNKFAAKAILFNTLSSFNTNTKSYFPRRAGISDTNSLWNDSFAYGIGGTDFGIQPPPGIVSVQVDSLNRGSIRKANVTLKAHNRFQFDVIELLYLRLGFTMMLEWGWDRYLDNNTGSIKQVGNTIIEERWFTSKNITQLDMLGFIQAKREEYNGNYDGFFGKVSNFTWNFNPDGTYDITIDLITVGDVIESIKTNTFAKGSFVSSDATEEQLAAIATTVSLSPDNIILKAAAVSSVAEYLFGKIDFLNDSGGILSPGFVAQGRGINTEYTIGSTTRKVLNYFELSTPSVNGKTAGSQYYVRLGEFLSQLEDLVIPRIENGTTKTPQLTINYTTENNLISFFPNQISLDPKICLIRPLIAYGDINGIIFPNYLTDLELYANVLVNPSSKKVQVLGYLMNMYINIEYIAGLLTSNGSPNQELSLFKFLQDLCNGINDALGGVNKIEPIIKNDNVITLIDQTLTIPEEDIVQLEVYGYNPTNQTSNFVKDIKFVSKITPQLASMISIGATAAGSNTSEIDGTAFSKWSEGLVDRFSQKIVEPRLLDPQTTISADRAVLKQEFDNDFEFVSPVSRFFRNLFGGNVTPDQKIISNPKYRSIYGQPMDFEKFFILASEILNNNAKNGAWYGDDLAVLTSTNYGVYLVEAFGGQLSDIKIYSSIQPKPYNFSRTADQGRYAHFNNTFIDQGKGAYKNYLNKLNQERFNTDNTPSSEVGFIPLSFEIVLEGISGIKIYNKLSVNTKFLPSNYPESLNFVITKVNHQISNNNWDTSLSTISIPNTEPYQLSRYASFSGTDTGNTGGGNAGGGNSGGGNSANAPKVTITSGIDLTQSNGDLMYYPQETKKLQLYLHHTAGNPAGDKSTVERTIRKDWAPKGFPLSTHYIIQGSGFTEYVFDEKYWSNHLAAQNSTKNLDKISLSVEIGAYGFLTPNGKGQYTNWAGGVVPTNQVTKSVDKYLKLAPYRGYENWHKYTDAQITALENLIVKWKKDHPGIIWEFDFDEMFPGEDPKLITKTNPKGRILSKKALDGIPGVYAHNSVRNDKVDIFPQANLIAMLKRQLKDVTKY
jgi:hypothetical protein